MYFMKITNFFLYRIGAFDSFFPPINLTDSINYLDIGLKLKIVFEQSTIFIW